MEEILNVSEPKFWVSSAFVLLVVLSYKKVSKMLAAVLDAESAKIKIELDAAKALRAEAEETLALYKRKQVEFTKEAEDILAKARDDAERNNALAQADLKIVLDTRLRQATDKIAREEAAAINEVRNRIVDITLAATRNLLASNTNESLQGKLLSNVISDIERKIH